MDCKEIRHQLHRMAEPSNEELKTSAFIRHELERLAPTKILTFPKGNHLLTDVMPVQSSETSFELNLAMFKFKHSVKRENDDEVRALKERVEELERKQEANQ